VYNAHSMPVLSNAVARVTSALLGMFFLVIASSSKAAASTEPGGQGALQSGLHSCFKTSSKRVPEFCGRLEIRWKLWALMGEPICNYILSWKLTDVKLQAPDGKVARSYALTELAPELARAARASELSISAVASVSAIARGGKEDLRLAFDTGVAVRPGGKSFNVPSGYDWDKFLIAATAPGQGWCEPKGRQYAAVADAKRMMIGGVRLSALQVCPSSMAVADALESALAKYCEKAQSSARPEFCEKQDNEKTKEPDKGAGMAKQRSTPAAASILDGGGTTAPTGSVADLLGAATDRPEVDRILGQQRAKFRAEASAACEGTLRQVSACYEKSQCAMPRGPSQATCAGIPGRPGRRIILSSGTCETQRCRNEHSKWLDEQHAEDDGKIRAWEKQWDEVHGQCREQDSARKQFSECQARLAPQCNPQALTQDSCVEKKMAGGPTDAQARALLAQERERRSVKATGARPNFLD
jgi:hypothetical protein